MKKAYVKPAIRSRPIRPGDTVPSAPMPEPPPHLRVQRAKTIVDHAGIKILIECESCGKEKYIVEGQTICVECKARSKHRGRR